MLNALLVTLAVFCGLRAIHARRLVAAALWLGDYVLIHVGFAISKIDEAEAEATLRLLQELGAYDMEIDQFKSSS